MNDNRFRWTVIGMMAVLILTVAWTSYANNKPVADTSPIQVEIVADPSAAALPVMIVADPSGLPVVLNDSVPVRVSVADSVPVLIDDHIPVEVHINP